MRRPFVLIQRRAETVLLNFALWPSSAASVGLVLGMKLARGGGIDGGDAYWSSPGALVFCHGFYSAWPIWRTGLVRLWS